MHPQCGFNCVQHTGDMEEGGGGGDALLQCRPKGWVLQRDSRRRGPRRASIPLPSPATADI